VKIRNRIILVLFLVAIVPMSAIVLFSYVSSLRAIEEAIAEDADALTSEIEIRMAQARTDLARRVERISQLPFRDREAAVDRERTAALYRSLAAELGDAAPLVRSFEFVPEAPPAAPVETPTEAPVSPVPVGAPPPAHRPAPRPHGAMKEPMIIDVHEIMEAVDEAIAELDEADFEAGPVQIDKLEILAQARRGLEQARAAAQAVGGTAQTEELILAAGATAFESAGTAVQPGDLRVIFDQGVEFPVYEDGAMVGEIRAEFEDEVLLRRVLGRSGRNPNEIAFAITPEGELFAKSEEESARLEEIGLGTHLPNADSNGLRLDDWVVATSAETPSGLTFGIARPVEESLSRMRAIAARNFAFGAGLISIAMLIVYPLSRRITQKLGLVTAGAERLATGDFSTRVDVEANNEIGQLARAFNEMAGELEESQQRLVNAELIKAEYDRKSDELEQARRFQLSLLPKALPLHPRFEIAAAMETATEVGGDYYDFHASNPNHLTVAIGDATGHGAAAGTMVTVIKSLFSSYTGQSGLAEFLDEAAATVRRMELGRMAMAFAVADLTPGELRLSSAGMPPALVHRKATDEVEELLVEGMPLGGIQFAYREIRVPIETGDTVLWMSDGLPELSSLKGETLGYDRCLELFREAAGGTPQQVIDRLLGVACEWSGNCAPDDDITFVAIRVL